MGTGPASAEGDAFGLTGVVFDGRFRIEERIAEGGFAVVYRACQVALDRQVALKVLKAPIGYDAAARAEFGEKFASEARTIARIRHPHIVDVYDFSVSSVGTGELAPWMALEWLEGESLAKHLKRRRDQGEHGLPASEAVVFLRPVIEALAHAHVHGIVHRDVKPSNVMVSKTPAGPSLRVLDFGIAKIMADDQSPSSGHTRTESAPVFSPAYAAPEQVTFSRTGPWTDVHALGLLLSEVMTDEPPFSDDDPDVHIFEQVMAQRRPTPASRGRDVGAFESIIAKSLALSPKDRWRNAGDLLAALEDTLAGGTAYTEPATKSPGASDRSAGDQTAPTTITRPWRNRTLLFSAFVVAVVLMGVAWGIRANHALPRNGTGQTPSEITTFGEQPVASGPPSAASQPAARVSTIPAESTPSGGPGAPSPRQPARPSRPLTKTLRNPPAVIHDQPKTVAPPVLQSDGRELFDDPK